MTQPELLSEDELLANIAAAMNVEPMDESPVAPDFREAEHDPDEIEARGYQHVRPLVSAADGLVDYIQNPDGRFMLGLPDVDLLTRGFGKGELVYVIGHSHEGKTQVLLQAVVNNPNRRIILFTPDEPAELVLSKLVSIVSGVDAETLEERIKAGDQTAIETVRSVAMTHCKNLVVVDEPLSWDSMWRALHEAEDMLGGPVEVGIFDFLEQLPGGREDGGSDGVQAKSTAVKRFVASAGIVGLAIHQRSRTSGERGKPAGMTGMRYGGENDAIFVLEVYRKIGDGSLTPVERELHQRTVTVNVCKNKRPPCRKGEVDLHLDPNTGRIRTLTEDDVRVRPASERTWERRRDDDTF